MINVLKNVKLKMEEEIVDGEIVCDDEAIAKIIIKIGEEKKKTTISDMESIHPMYEALIALLRRQLQDTDISQRFIKDENSLREVLITDAFLSFLQQPRHKDELRTLLRDGASLQEIVHRAALYLSEDKRTKDGKVLHPASEFSYKDKDFVGALRVSSPANIYVASSEIGNINSAAKNIRLWRKIKIFSTIGLSAFLALSGLFFRQRISEYGGKMAKLTTEIADLEKKLGEGRKEFDILYKENNNLIQAVDSKKNQLISLRREYLEKQAGVTREISDLQKKIGYYSERAKEKESRLEELVKSEQELTLKEGEKNRQVEDLTKQLSALEGRQKDIERTIKERGDYINRISKEKGDFDLAEACTSLGLRYKKEGKEEKAAEWYERALKFNPDDSSTCNSLGVIYYKRKEYKKAIELFERALTLNHNLNSCIRNLGAAYEVLGDRDKALEYYQKYLELKLDDPDLEQINERVKKLRRTSIDQ